MCELDQYEEHTETDLRGINGFVDELVIAITQRRIYWDGHPRVVDALKLAWSTLREELTSTDEPRLELGAADGYLFHERQALRGVSLSARRLLDPLDAMGSGGLRISRVVEMHELVTLTSLLAHADPELRDIHAANQWLRENGVVAIELLPPYVPEPEELGEDEQERTQTDTQIQVPVQLYQSMVYVLQDAMLKACRGSGFNSHQMKGLVHGVLSQLAGDPRSMLSVGRYDRYDAFTFGHSIRVCLLALHFARSLTQDERILQRVGMAALLHDLGKAWVPFEILHHRGSLSPEQRAEMNRHCEHGAEILLGMADGDPMAVASAFGHHRRGITGGYPQTLHGWQVSVGTRIVKICDVYEALTAVRPYKAGMSPTRAYRIMLSMRGHFDLPLLRRFIEVNGIYPVGSRVRLDTGEIARVEQQTDVLTQPVVSVETAPDGELLPLDHIHTVDLRTDWRDRPREIGGLLEDAHGTLLGA